MKKFKYTLLDSDSKPTIISFEIEKEQELVDKVMKAYSPSIDTSNVEVLKSPDHDYVFYLYHGGPIMCIAELQNK